MSSSYESILQDIEDIYGDGTDKRYFTVRELQALYMYEKYLVNLLDEVGVSYRGQSVKYDIPVCLLVLKGTREGENIVAFVNGLSIIECKQICVRKLLDGALEWRVDKFQ